MDSCIAIVSDMIFASRISSTAKMVGTKCRIISNAGDLQSALESQELKTVLVDMSCDTISPEEAIRTVKSSLPSARVIAFFSHVQTDLMEQAKAAGADDVWPRSTFVQRLPGLLDSGASS